MNIDTDKEKHFRYSYRCAFGDLSILIDQYDFTLEEIRKLVDLVDEWAKEDCSQQDQPPTHWHCATSPWMTEKMGREINVKVKP